MNIRHAERLRQRARRLKGLEPKGVLKAALAHALLEPLGHEAAADEQEHDI